MSYRDVILEEIHTRCEIVNKLCYFTDNEYEEFLNNDDNFEIAVKKQICHNILAITDILQELFGLELFDTLSIQGSEKDMYEYVIFTEDLFKEYRIDIGTDSYNYFYEIQVEIKKLKE